MSARARGEGEGMPGFEAVLADLKAKRCRPVYVLEGEDSLRMENVVGYLRDAVLEPAAQAFNYRAFAGEDADLSVVLQQALSYPMLAARQVIWLRDAERSVTGGEKEIALERYLARPPQTTVLILTAAKLDGRRRWVKKAKEAGYHFAFAPLRGASLRLWLRTTAQRQGLSLDDETVELLIGRTGEDLHALAGELAKLAVLSGESGRRLSSRQLRELVLEQRETDPFELVKLLGGRDARRAVALWRRWITEGRSAQELAPLLAWRVRQLALVGAMQEEGRSPAEIQAAAGVPPFALAPVQQAARSWGSAGLARGLQACLRCDGALKRSPLRAELVLERTILEICLAMS